jgi:hypothetical protein
VSEQFYADARLCDRLFRDRAEAGRGSIFPQELPLLLALGGLRVVDRYGDWSRTPFRAEAALQVCIGEAG